MGPSASGQVACLASSASFALEPSGLAATGDEEESVCDPFPLSGGASWGSASRARWVLPRAARTRRPGPILDADLEARGALEFTCGVGCEFEGEFFNSGLGCARNVRGVTRLLRGDGAEIARSNWSLPVDERIGIRESERYEGCCFTPPDVALMGSYSTEISWDETDCI